MMRLSVTSKGQAQVPECPSRCCFLPAAASRVHSYDRTGASRCSDDDDDDDDLTLILILNISINININITCHAGGVYIVLKTRTLLQHAKMFFLRFAL